MPERPTKELSELAKATRLSATTLYGHFRNGTGHWPPDAPVYRACRKTGDDIQAVDDYFVFEDDAERIIADYPEREETAAQRLERENAEMREELERLKAGKRR